ncbi:MAG TPA: hypothetical protein VFA56_04215 [Gaiellaceae bacterium]|nr:hypothetical protein [Gaiellaceae bacterium]
MSRLLLTALAVVAAATLGATAAQATVYDVTLAATPTAVTTGHSVALSGEFTGAGTLAGVHIHVVAYADESCVGHPRYVEEATTGPHGLYTMSASWSEPGTYWLVAAAYNRYHQSLPLAVSECVKVTVTAATTPDTPGEPETPTVPETETAAPAISSSYLCWNREMAYPIAYPDAIADEMWKTGKYLEPFAILGNVVGGTNIGAYHLVCSVPSTMKATGEGLGGSGEVYSAAEMKAYHAEHPSGDDLNVYHIYK